VSRVEVASVPPPARILHDISVLVHARMPTWPGDPGVTLERVSALADGAVANVSELCCGVHTGTHVDAPNHFIDGAGGIDSIDLDALYGPALVVDLRDDDAIDEPALVRSKLEDAERVLFRTRNSLLWEQSEVSTDFVSITPDAARLLVGLGVRLVGIDYLSVGSPETHRVLLGAGVICLEGIDLRAVDPGPYELYCAPLKLEGADGAPARAVLRQT
jgi:arylformamidase